MTLTNSTQIEKPRFWACGRPMGGYPGSFPVGFLSRIESQYGIAKKEVLFPYGGAMPTQFEEGVGEKWLINDLNPELGHVTHDATDPPEKWKNSFDVVLADPPYGRTNSEELYDLEHPGYKNILMEAATCVKPGGTLFILDHMVYMNYPNRTDVNSNINLKREHPIAVTCGPNTRIRVCNVFHRQPELGEFDES